MNMRITLLAVVVSGLATLTACKNKKHVPHTQSDIIIIERDNVLDDRQSGVFSVTEIDWEDEDLK